MNDPHVNALIYQVIHDKSVSYQNAKPLEIENPGFRLKVEGNWARFELKKHYPTAQEARAAVGPFVEKWEFEISLHHRLGRFALRFDKAEIIDRDPTPGVVNVSGHVSTGIPTVSISVTVDAQYPAPSQVPMDINNPDVRTMRHRYEGYRQGHEPLPSMAYFCCEVFTKRLSDNARDAADKHQISHSLIRYVNNLASNKGGAQARHAHAVDHELTPDESRKLEKAVVAMITRAAKVLADPNQHMPEINLGNLLEISP